MNSNNPCIPRFLKSFLFFLLHFSFFIFHFSCSETPTDNNTITVSGTVQLEGMTDHSGVTIGLYKPVELDTALVRINQQYPQIGVQISQETEFDHRDQKPVYTVQSNASGDWTINGVNPGEYNIVAEADSFGWQYLYEINLPASQALEFNLYKSIYISGNITQSINLHNNQSVIVESDATLGEGASLILNGENKIIFNSGTRLTILGTIETNSISYCIATSSDENHFGNGIYIQKNPQTIGKIIFKHLKTALSIQNINSETAISNIIIRDCDSGIYNKNIKTTLENALFYNINILGVETVSDFETNKSIFLNGSDGMKIVDVVSLIKNCYLSGFEIALRPHKGGIRIENNYLRSNEIAVAVSSSDCAIQNNDFMNNNLDIELNRTYVQYPNYEYSNPAIEGNNFYGQNIAVSIVGSHGLYGENIGGLGIKADLMAPNNYWDTTIDFNIEHRITDAGDVQDYKYHVVYTPILQQASTTAGIGY